MLGSEVSTYDPSASSESSWRVRRPVTASERCRKSASVFTVSGSKSKVWSGISVARTLHCSTWKCRQRPRSLPSKLTTGSAYCQFALNRLAFG